jgi:microcystin-dependent protein
MWESQLRGEELMNPMLGQIMLFAGNFAPVGWEFCAGQMLPINQNQALFSLLGTTFGGDGEVNFALPDLRTKAPVSGSNYIIAIEGSYPARS